MTPTIELLCAHKSIRKFTEQKLSQPQIESILKAAQQASSSCFLQCTTIIQITDMDLRAKLAEHSGNQVFINQAAEFWIFCADFNRHIQIDPSIELEFVEQLLVGSIDTSIMAQNALIAAESLGLGGVYIGGLRNNLTEVTELLKLPKFVLPLFGMCFGYPAEEPESKPRLPTSLIFQQNHYQAINQDELTQYDNEMMKYYIKRGTNSRTDNWSHHISKQLKKEKRPLVLAYLHQQGWAKK